MRVLARRLSRDEDLKARWGGTPQSALRSARKVGFGLNSDLAIRVNRVITAEPAVVAEPIAEPVGARRRKPPRALVDAGWWAALAASVALRPFCS